MTVHGDDRRVKENLHNAPVSVLKSMLPLVVDIFTTRIVENVRLLIHFSIPEALVNIKSIFRRHSSVIPPVGRYDESDRISANFSCCMADVLLKDFEQKELLFSVQALHLWAYVKFLKEQHGSLFQDLR